MEKKEKRYEDVYSNKLKLKKCKLKSVSTDIGLTSQQYLNKMKKMVSSYEETIFDNLVKYNWLTRHFHYRGFQRKYYRLNGFGLDAAFGVFMKHYVGTDKILFSGRGIAKIISYFDDFFPDFYNRDPFKEKLAYPFKYVSVSYLAVVYQMKNRMEFLNYAEKHKMIYTEFLDYIINYVYCVNEDAGREVYSWDYVTFNMPYVKVLDFERVYKSSYIDKNIKPTNIKTMEANRKKEIKERLKKEKAKIKK